MEGIPTICFSSTPLMCAHQLHCWRCRPLFPNSNMSHTHHEYMYIINLSYTHIKYSQSHMLSPDKLVTRVNPMCDCSSLKLLLKDFYVPCTYLIFVIFFTRAKFLENKIYTEKRQFFALKKKRHFFA